MRICFLIGSLSSGGAERTVQYLSEYGVKNGYDVDVVTLTDVKFYDLHKKVNYYPLDVYKKTKNPLYRVSHIFKRLRLFRKYVKQYNPDIIYPILQKKARGQGRDGKSFRKKAVERSEQMCYNKQNEMQKERRECL